MRSWSVATVSLSTSRNWRKRASNASTLALQPGSSASAARKKWRSGTYPCEDADAAHVRVWGEHCDLAELTELPALAERLWFPLLASERGPV